MLLHVETNPSLKCRRELYDLNPEAKILAPQMSVGIGQFIALLLCFFFDLPLSILSQCFPSINSS